MSTCISMRGEYSSHDLDREYICRRCLVLDEDALIDELTRLRLTVARCEALAEKWHREATEAKNHGTPNPRMSKRHAARSLTRTLTEES